MQTTDIARILRAKGMRATKSRTALFSKIASAKKPLSADELFRLLSKTPMDLVTVYRTLQSFIAAGLIRAVDLKRGYMLYEIRDEHDHHHLVCVSCGATEDFTGCTVNMIAQAALKKSSRFADITDHSLELFGRCKTCVA